MAAMPSWRHRGAAAASRCRSMRGCGSWREGSSLGSLSTRSKWRVPCDPRRSRTGSVPERRQRTSLTRPGRPLGEVLAERLSDLRADIDEAQWDSRKCADGNWQVSLVFTAEGTPRLAEWVFDPRSRHVSPANDTAAPLCLADAGLPPVASHRPGSATVTPIGSRLSQAPAEPESRPAPPEPPRVPAPPRTFAAEQDDGLADGAQQVTAPERPARKKAAGGRPRRASVPSWDEIMFGTSRQPD